MKTKHFNMLLTALLSILLASCSKWLDEPEPEATVPIEEIGSGTGGLDAAMTGAWAYWTFNSGITGNIFIYPEALGDYVVGTNVVSSTNRVFRAYQRQLNSEGYDMIGETLQRASRAENLTNYVIKSIRESPPTDLAWATNGNRLTGEAYFLRAWIHFEYLKMEGDQWITKTPGANATGRGPLLRFKPQLTLDDLPQARTPLAAAYDSIIADLKKAEQLIPEAYNSGIHDASFQARASRAAASALLAKVYWQQNDFANALVHIEKAIGTTPGTSLFPLATNFDQIYKRGGLTNTTNTNTKSEVILEYVAVSPSKVYTLAGLQMDNAWTRGTTTALPVNWFYFGDYFKNLTSFDLTKDKRYLELINRTYSRTANGKTYTGWSSKKFNVALNLVFIRSAELILMRAEINARRNQLQAGLDDLNMIRVRAGLAALTIIDISTQTALVNEIVRERVRELFAEGYRSHELKRLGSLTDGQPDEVFFLPGDRESIDFGIDGLGGPGPVKWNNRGLVWNITNDEMAVNPLANNN
ncbi:MAG: RagB/SusD family nutrient uptake outer membrane protein [Chitinophagaceae bacterium]|nr:RagB/SusD family nutrient uptake outer membrane protein [Chitinophagaceae bacterium]